MRTTKTRALIGVLVAALLGLFTAVAAAPAAPAAAGGSSMVICFPVYKGNVVIDWHCFDLPVEQCQPPCGPWGFDLKENIVLPVEVEHKYVDQLGQGFQQIGLGDLRGAADSFLGAAATLGRTEVTLGEAGFVDLERNELVPMGDSWLIAAGTDVGNGIWMMQQALSGRDPSPWIARGMEAFTSAYHHCAVHR